MNEQELYKAMLEVERRQIVYIAEMAKHANPDDRRTKMNAFVEELNALTIEACQRFNLADPDETGNLPDGYTSFEEWTKRMHAIVMN